MTSAHGGSLANYPATVGGVDLIHYDSALLDNCSKDFYVDHSVYVPSFIAVLMCVLIASCVMEVINWPSSVCARSFFLPRVYFVTESSTFVTILLMVLATKVCVGYVSCLTKWKRSIWNFSFVHSVMFTH